MGFGKARRSLMSLRGRITTKSHHVICPGRWAPLFTWLIVASSGEKFLTGWCESKDDLETLRKRVVRKLSKILRLK